MISCQFCGQEVDPNAPTTWTQVTVWVYGPKRNGACMQGTEALGYAHDQCAQLERRGIPHGQKAMF